MEYGAALTWWLFAVAIGFAGFPIAAILLRRFPDRGAALSFPLGVAVLTLPIYWIGHLSYGPLTIWLGLVVLFVAATVLAWRGPTLEFRRFGEAAVVFTVAFVLLVAVRATDPSIVPLGGEKFLDYGLLNTVLRADVLPPEDFWFAGEPLQYYYLGHLMAGAATTITGIAPRYAYNLSVAWFYAMLVVSAYGVAGSIAASRGYSFRPAAAVGALFVGFASNLVPAVQALLWPLPAGIARTVASLLVTENPDAFYQLTPEELSDPTGVPSAYDWIPTRVIENTINEFPLFAFVNGDLHAHMMSQPFLLLVIGLAFAYYLTPATARARRRGLVLGAIPPVAGLIGGINTWSFPTAVGLTWLAVLFAPTDPRDLLPGILADSLQMDSPASSELSRVVASSLAATGVLVLGVLWTLPFFLGPATGGADRTIGFVVDRSGFVEFSLVHGWVLIVFGTYFGIRSRDRLGTDRLRIALLGAIALVLALLADAAAFVLVLPLAVVAWWRLRRGESDLGFESVLFVGGAGIVLLVEVLFLAEGDGGNRMNTVFKGYAQVWVIWATAAAVPVGRALSGRRAVSDDRLNAAATVSAIVLIASVSIYGGVVLGEQFSGDDDRTLDATTWAQTTHPEEWEAIRWIETEIDGQPNFVSAPGCGCNPSAQSQYRWMNAPSTFTGVPTVVGWGHGSHQSKYRGSDAYLARVDDVEAIYTGSSEQRRALLSEYDVEYVYVGPNERRLYGDPDFGDRSGFDVAVDFERVTIYRVDQSEL